MDTPSCLCAERVGRFILRAVAQKTTSQLNASTCGGADFFRDTVDSLFEVIEAGMLCGSVQTTGQTTRHSMTWNS